MKKILQRLARTHSCGLGKVNDRNNSKLGCYCSLCDRKNRSKLGTRRDLDMSSSSTRRICQGRHCMSPKNHHQPLSFCCNFFARFVSIAKRIHRVLQCRRIDQVTARPTEHHSRCVTCCTCYDGQSEATKDSPSMNGNQRVRIGVFGVFRKRSQTTSQ